MSAPAEERTRSGALRLDFERLRSDVGALAAMERGSAAKDKPQVPWIEARLRDAGAHEIRVEPFRYQRRWIWRHGAHAVAGIGAAAAGPPAGAALAVATAVSWEADTSGKRQWTAGLLPGAEGANVVARVPAAGPAERTFVVLAHHDAARTGWLWRSPFVRGRPRPLGNPAHAALAMVAIGCLAGRRLVRALGGAILAGLALAGLDVARGRIVPGANDNATGVAALLALVAALARDPLERTDVIAVFTDCEETGMGGAGAWFTAHASELDPATTFVLSLDTLGSGAPAVVTRESSVQAVYRPDDLDWADRGALRAAVAPPARTRLAVPTDAIIGRHAELRALSLVSVDRAGTLGRDYHMPSDLPENVDWHSVEQCTRLAGGVARVWDSVS